MSSENRNNVSKNVHAQDNESMIGKAFDPNGIQSENTIEGDDPKDTNDVGEMEMIIENFVQSEPGLKKFIINNVTANENSKNTKKNYNHETATDNARSKEYKNMTNGIRDLKLTININNETLDKPILDTVIEKVYAEEEILIPNSENTTDLLNSTTKNLEIHVKKVAVTKEEEALEVANTDTSKSIKVDKPSDTNKNLGDSTHEENDNEFDAVKDSNESNEDVDEMDITLEDDTGAIEINLKSNTQLFSPEFKVFVRENQKGMVKKVQTQSQ